MSFSLLVLSILVIMLICGAGQRVLDKLRMNDKWALGLLVAIIVGIIIPPISIGKLVSFSIGGFLIPLGICAYLMIRTGWSSDLLRAVIGSIVTAGLILLIQYLMPSETPEDIVVDNVWLYGLVSGSVAYILGRSRRNAFICSILGIFLASIIQFLLNLGVGIETPLRLGLAGAFDTIILSTLIAVGLAEGVGTAVEMVSGKSPQKVFDFESGEFIEIGGEDSTNKDVDVTGLSKKCFKTVDEGDDTDEK